MRSYKSRVRLVAVGIVCLGVLTACPGADNGPAPDPQVQPTLFTGTVVAGVLTDVPGVSTGTLNPAGFDIDVMNKIGEGLQVPITPTFLSVPARGPYLKQKRATIDIAAYSITTQRNTQGIDFAGPYLVTPQALLVRANDSSITTPASLAGKSICAVQETTGAEVNIKGTRQNTNPTTNQDCIKALDSGSADGVFNDLLILYGYTQASPGKYKVLFPGLFGETQYWGIGILGGHKADCLKLNDIIAKFVANDWRSTFIPNFPDAVRDYTGSDASIGSYESQFKPKGTEKDLLSCKL